MKKEKPPFKVGDLVTTKFYPTEADVIRKVISCTSDMDGGSWSVAADGGKPCDKCKRSAIVITSLGSIWFKKASKRK